MSVRAKLGGLRGRGLDVVARWSPTVAAYGDWLFPENHQSFGGPMNGQPRRRSLTRTIVEAMKFDAVVETGTFRGTTTDFLWHVTGAPVWTVESNPRYAAFAARRFRATPEVTVHVGDSRAFLPQLAADPRVPKRRVLFYLDAHWGAELPLRSELLTVFQAWDEPIVMIDDFEVPDDPGYGFDDYGPGGRLCLSYLPESEMAGFVPLLPAVPSAEEGGLKRGCVVIAPDGHAQALLDHGVPLRRADVLP